MNLVIVESPAKGRTIEKYLGQNYKVVASFGHVRDLPEYELGVDVEHNFQPKYIIPPRSRKIVSFLERSVKDANNIYLATDYDREGEAIAWHIIQAVGLNEQMNKKTKEQKNISRITFHEITKDAIQEAIKHPRDIDMNLVDAQQARRILDRLVGYKLSPFLWKKVYRGLSAGRVQSVSVRLIVDREREIENFKPQEYWTITARLQSKEQRAKSKEFIALLIGKNGEKLDKLSTKSDNDARKIISELEEAEYRVKDVIQKRENRWPYPPFTTSTLQQEASYRLGFSAKKTMKLAQDLYEAGQITYMRTDSTNLSWLAINSVRKLVEKDFGRDYLPEKARVYKTKIRGAQEAHEAIRPSYVKTRTEDLRPKTNFTEDHLELYDLIWRRMVACQMNPMRINVTVADIDAKIKDRKSKIKNDQENSISYNFQAKGSKIVFDGFSKVWPIKIEEKDLPLLKTNEILDLIKLLRDQHFTQPPPRYSEASLIKALEEQGIGRPSTYAPIISTIQERGYVRLERKYFYPQEVGFIVTGLLVNHFPDIVDIDFTARMEKDLDKIAEGKEKWVRILSDFYRPFEKNLENKYQEISKKDIMEEKETKESCPKCGKKMIIRMGRFGKFLACSGFPDCKYTKQLIIKTGLKCPECPGGEVIERRTKKGKVFWGCSKYPKCKWASWEDPRGKIR